jgi:hypothetical protein
MRHGLQSWLDAEPPRSERSSAPAWHPFATHKGEELLPLADLRSTPAEPMETR